MTGPLCYNGGVAPDPTPNPNRQETDMSATTEAIAARRSKDELTNTLWQADITMADGRPAATLTDARFATQELGVIPVEPVDDFDPANSTWLVILGEADTAALEDMGYVVLDGPNGRVDVELG